MHVNVEAKVVAEEVAITKVSAVTIVAARFTKHNLGSQ
jgi:hypothetical protein